MDRADNSMGSSTGSSTGSSMDVDIIRHCLKDLLTPHQQMDHQKRIYGVQTHRIRIVLDFCTLGFPPSHKLLSTLPYYANSVEFE
jgi:hypothetical protein